MSGHIGEFDEIFRLLAIQTTLIDMWKREWGTIGVFENLTGTVSEGLEIQNSKPSDTVPNNTFLNSKHGGNPNL